MTVLRVIVNLRVCWNCCGAMSRPVFSETRSFVTEIGESSGPAQGLDLTTKALGKPTAEWTVESTHPKGWCATGHSQPYLRVTTGTSTTTSFTAQVPGRTIH